MEYTNIIKVVKTFIRRRFSMLNSGRALDSGARGQGFDPHSGRRFVSLSKTHLFPKSTDSTHEAMAPSRRDSKFVNRVVK